VAIHTGVYKKRKEFKHDTLHGMHECPSIRSYCFACKFEQRQPQFPAYLRIFGVVSVKSTYFSWKTDGRTGQNDLLNHVGSSKSIEQIKSLLRKYLDENSGPNEVFFVVKVK
jgi:hypothetical protein